MRLEVKITVNLSQCGTSHTNTSRDDGRIQGEGRVDPPPQRESVRLRQTIPSLNIL